MKPVSSHWADLAAMKIVNERQKEDVYVVASGITPSGRIHFGNFREAMTVDLVGRALKALGKEVRVIHSWDNFDTFRKVPKGLPEGTEFEPFLRQPIARIPDPWGEEDNYAKGRIRSFEAELARVGIEPDFLYQEEIYASGVYAEKIRHVLENVDKVKAVLNEHRSSPLADDWLPTSIYCEKCSKDEMEFEKYLGEWDYQYKCTSCGHEATTDIRTTKNIKLLWRVDWPMRWVHEKVDFEPGGKDHSSQGGSFDTGKSLVKALWNQEAPMYLQYDFVMIKGGTGKMSSSSGDLYTLDEVLDVYEPQMVRWIFATQRPNHDFSVAFDEDVFKVYEEFDKSEKLAFEPEPEKKANKWLLNRRNYEFSLIDGKMPEKPVYRAGFRVLCNRLQIVGLDVERVIKKFYQDDLKTDDDLKVFHARAERALFWINHYAPEQFKYTVRESAAEVPLNDSQRACLTSLREAISEVSFDSMEPKAINDLVYEKGIHGSECEPKDAFVAIYQRLIGRDQGPRLGGFLKEIGKEKLLELL